MKVFQLGAPTNPATRLFYFMRALVTRIAGNAYRRVLSMAGGQSVLPCATAWVVP